MSTRWPKLKLIRETRRVHVCSHCGFKGYWGPSWSWTWKPVGRGYAGYEVMLEACSDECARALGMKEVAESPAEEQP